jgi:transcriptional regulator with GAF, ATPase, and Fis domain
MERGIVMFLNEEEDILVGFYSNKLSSVRVKDICIKKEEELFILVVKKKEVIIVPDTELEEEHPARRLTAKYKSRSLVIIPLVMNEERVMGIIWFDNQERLWEYNHTAVEETRDFLSHAAVVAIDAAYSRRLLKTLRESKGKLEKELKSTTDKFAALEKFTQYLTRSTEIDEMAKIFDEVANMLDLKSYRLMLVDASNNFLFTLAWRGFLSEEIRIKIGEGIVGKVVLTGKPTLSIEDGNITNYELYETPLCIPLKKHDKVIGVIEIRSLKENTSIDPIKYYVLLSLANLLTVGLSRRVTSPISSAPSPTIILDKE